MMRNPFCKLIRAIPVKRQEWKPVRIYLSGTKYMYMLNDFYKIPIGIYIEFWDPLDFP